MAVLVTGGMGFIGLHVIGQLLDAGEDVICTWNRSWRVHEAFEHRSHYHSHEHNHPQLTHAHKNHDEETERREHDEMAHIHDHSHPTGA